MSKFHIDCLLEYSVYQATEFIFQVEAAQHEWQNILTEHLSITPAHLNVHYFQRDQPLNRLIRLSATENSHFRLHYTSHIETYIPERPFQADENSLTQLPSECLFYLAPSRFCESDLLTNIAIRTFGNSPTGYQRVQAICDWIYNNISYESGSSNNTTSAKDILINRAGVCRDFAHLGIALCRALGIPARMVVGYVEIENFLPDFHAIFEAYLEGGWVLFDPTRLAPVENLVRIGTGIDAGDVAFSTFYGEIEMLKIEPIITR